MPLPCLLIPLFEPGLDPGTFRVRADQLLRALVNCRPVVFVRYHLPSGELRVEGARMEDPVRSGFFVLGRQLGRFPEFRFRAESESGHAFLRVDLMGEAAWQASDIYQSGFLPVGVGDFAAIPLPAGDDTLAFIGLERSTGRYGDEDRECLRALQPHLVNALHLAQALTALEHPLPDLGGLIAAGLSPREADVLRWLAQGKSNADIAAILGIGLATVKTHLARVFDKLGVANRHAALLRAHELARRGGSSPGMPFMSADKGARGRGI